MCDAACAESFVDGCFLATCEAGISTEDSFHLCMRQMDEGNNGACTEVPCGAAAPRTKCKRRRAGTTPPPLLLLRQPPLASPSARKVSHSDNLNVHPNSFPEKMRKQNSSKKFQKNRGFARKLIVGVRHFLATQAGPRRRRAT